MKLSAWFFAFALTLNQTKILWRENLHFESWNMRFIVTMVFLCILLCTKKVNADVLYGIDLAADQLISIDVDTGAGTVVGSLGVSGINAFNGLAFDSSNVLWCTESISGRLLRIDLSNGQAVVHANLSSSVRGIEFDPSGTLFGTQAGNFVSIDPDTGAVTEIGSHGFQRAFPLAVQDGVYYSHDDELDQLFSIDEFTGQGTAIGSSGGPSISSLTFDSAGVLYGFDTGADTLVRIDPVSGAITTIGSTGFRQISSLAAFASIPEPVSMIVPLLLMVAVGLRREKN